MTFEEYELQFQSSSFEEWEQKVTQALKDETEALIKQREKVEQMLQKKKEYEVLYKQEKKKCGIIAKIFKKEEAAKAAKQAQEYSENIELYRKAFLKEYDRNELMTKEATELQNYVRLALAMRKG